jgi:TRAP-type C4-dicarboxylate transport system substrate-binding protein
MLAARGAEAQQQPAEGTTRQLSVATLAPAGSTWMRGLEAWNRELRRRTNKALGLRIFPGGVQGDENEVVRKMRSGRLDGGAITAVGLSKIHRPALVFQMPGMFSNVEQLDRARAAVSQDVISAFNTAGFQFMGWADVGFSRLFSRTPVATPDQLRSLHPYVWRDDLVLPALFAEANVSATPLQIPEVLTALQTNRVDSFFTSPVAAISLQWSTRVTHMTDLSVAVLVGATVFSNAAVNALPADQQAILRETGAQFHSLLINNLRRDERSALSSMQSRGITVVTPQDRAAWDALLERARNRLVGNIAPAEFINRVRAARGG